MSGGNGHWDGSKHVARGILRDRTQRRKWLANVLFIVLVQMGLGLWALDDWLQESPLAFLIWWASCAVATCFLLLFALYDMLAVIREEREKPRNDRET